MPSHARKAQRAKSSHGSCAQGPAQAETFSLLFGGGCVVGAVMVFGLIMAPGR